MQVQIQPPRATNAAAGRHQYQIAIGSEQAAAVIMTIPGVLTIAPYEQFVADMQPRTLKNRSTTQILITNEGNITSTFHVIGRDPGEALHFIDPRKQQEEKKKVRQTVNAPNTPRWLRPILRLRLMQMLPFMRDARQAQAFIRRFSQLGKSIGLAPKEQPQEEKAPTRLAALHSRLPVAAGTQDTVNLTVEPLDRPFLPKPPQLLPFEVQVATATGTPQTLSGQVEVTSVLTRRQLMLAALLLLLLLLPCAWLLYSVAWLQPQQSASATATAEFALTQTAVAADLTATAIAATDEAIAATEAAIAASATLEAELTPIITPTAHQMFI
jgi:hypothetical protein